MAQSKAFEIIERNTAQMLLAYPWWATIYLHLIRVETTDVPTMAVDGTHMFFNPQFTEEIEAKYGDHAVMAVLMHETAHCALLHPFRRSYRDPLSWNIACDQAVNALLEQEGLMLPPDCIPAGPMDKTAEELYNEDLAKKYRKMIQDVLDSVSGQIGKGDGAIVDVNGHKYYVGGTGKEGMTEQKWRDAVAQSRGYMPAGIARTVDEAQKSKRNWKDELAQFVHAMHKADSHSWNRPSRRIKGLPGWKREPEAKIAICVDTSGSISGGILAAFIAECKGICAIGGITVILVMCDAAVGQVIEPGEPFPEHFVGGGGTDFRPAINEAVKHEPNAIVYFTDGDGTFPDGCALPVLWALTKKCNVPFGEEILLGEDN